MKFIYKLLSIVSLLFFTSINAQTTLSIGDISIIGFNANSPDNFTFVTWVNLSNSTQIKFTDNGFLASSSSTTANNGRGGENFVTWTNNTGSTIVAGTVIKIENSTTPAASIGSISQILSGISNGGDQIFAYQGTGAGTSTSTSDWGSNANPTTFTGTILYGLNFASAWLSSGTVNTNVSYLPSDLNVSNGNIAISTSSVTSAQFTGSRTNLSTFAAYRTNVNNSSNWTTLTGTSTTSLSTTAFTLSCTPPSTQVSALGFTSTSSTSTTLGWTNGSGANTIVVAKSGSAVNSDPVSGTTYTANATFASGTQIGTGNYVVYSGTGTSVAITGLSAATTYHFAVYTFDSSGASSCYKISGATANETTTCSTPINVSGASTSNAINTQATINWTNSGCFDEVYVFIDTTSGLGSAPSGNGSAYTANAVYSSNGQCIYKNTGTSVTVTGLTNSSTYYFEIYTRKDSVWSSGVEVSATPVLVPVMTELIVPQFMASKTAASINNARTPIAVCLKIDDLTPNTAYDIKIGLALTSDASNIFGAGNIFNGTSYSGQTRLNAFTTNGTGSSGAVWFYLQPTGNGTRFGGGQIHEIRVGYTTSGGSFSSTPNFEGVKTITTLDVQNTATSPTSDDGAFIKGTTSSSFNGKYILAYDNVNGTGDPLFAYQVNTALPTNISQSDLPSDLNDVYLQSGTSTVGDFPVVVPIGANNSNGLRRFEFRNTDNTFFASVTDADGNWGSGMNTTTIARKDFQTINLFQGNEEDIRINGDIVLPGPLTLSNSLIFDSGKINTSSTNLLTLQNACTVSPAGGSATSFVDGPLAREVFGNSEVIFPIGKGTEWARATVTPRQNDSRGTQLRTYLCEYFKAGYGTYTLDTAQSNPLVVASKCEYWNISEQSAATGSDLETKIKLYWRLVSEVGSTTGNRQDLRVAHFTSGMWSYEGSAPTIVDNGINDGTIQSDWVSTFSPFSLGSISSLNPLPTKLISASATCNKNNNLIQWSVVEDNETNAFKIEKFQDKQYYPLVTINSKNKNTMNTYFYSDINATQNTIYRISEIGLDNNINVLATVKTLCNGNVENTVQVIQLENNIEVKFNDIDIISEFTLSNVLGQVIKVGHFTNSLTIDKTFLASGIYILNIKELNTSYKIYAF